MAAPPHVAGRTLGGGSPGALLRHRMHEAGHVARRPEPIEKEVVQTPEVLRFAPGRG